MQRHLLFLLLCLLFAGMTAATAAQSWDAFADFSVSGNPNGAWSYGWGTSATDHLDNFTDSQTGEDGSGTSMWDANAGCEIIANTSGSDIQQSDTFYNYTATLRHGQLTLLAAGAGNFPPIVRWTAPVAGTYTIAATFTGAAQSQQSTLLELAVNQQVVWNGQISNNGDQQIANYVAKLLPGDYVNCWVAPNTGSTYGIVSLDEQVTLATAPLSGVTGTPSTTLALTPGDQYTVTAQPGNGNAPEYMFAYQGIDPAGASQTLQGYSSTATCSWTPTAPGAYLFQIFAREKGTQTPVYQWQAPVTVLSSSLTSSDLTAGLDWSNYHLYSDPAVTGETELPPTGWGFGPSSPTTWPIVDAYSWHGWAIYSSSDSSSNSKSSMPMTSCYQSTLGS